MPRFWHPSALREKQNTWVRRSRARRPCWSHGGQGVTPHPDLTSHRAPSTHMRFVAGQHANLLRSCDCCGLVGRLAWVGGWPGVVAVVAGGVRVRGDWAAGLRVRWCRARSCWCAELGACGLRGGRSWGGLCGAAAGRVRGRAGRVPGGCVWPVWGPCSGGRGLAGPGARGLGRSGGRVVGGRGFAGPDPSERRPSSRACRNGGGLPGGGGLLGWGGARSPYSAV